MPGFRSDLAGRAPGFSAAVETFENTVGWGKAEQAVIISGLIDGATRDAGSTPTTLLRSGLLLARNTTSGKLTNYGAAGAYAVPWGVLLTSLRAQDLDGTDRDLFIYILVGGPVQGARIYGLDTNARSLMRGRFIFDDDIDGIIGTANYGAETAKTANYTVTAADNNTLFTNTGAIGAVTFTLPPIATSAGLSFEFFVVADQTVTVASAEGDNIVVFNDVAADSVSFSTAGQKIGGRVRLTANSAGTKWYVTNLSPGNTITVAT